MVDTTLTGLAQGSHPDFYYGVDQTGASRKFETGRIFNVRDYGALGNASHDDKPNIQAAINAADIAGGTVFFPPGKYQINSRLTTSGGGVCWN